MQYNLKEQNFKIKANKVIKSSFKSNKNDFLTENLINDLYEHLANLVSEKVAAKASINSVKIFSYYLNTKVEEVILVLEKKYNSWNIIFKVCPAYLDDYQNFRKIEGLIDKKAIVLSLKDFYFNTIKKYYN
tara:strand:- start:7264 stop:7656 length:393 start_codon:yes stop_codon:yes gene_type:complete